ncbi:MAG TPA: hypothetical protein VJU77_03630 [Chthoniobacterales bacterium]|nr:hypothetical protein [Chthoniobacterales bacterium]
MFPLNANALPPTAAELAQAINASLRSVFTLNRDPAEVRDLSYPHLAAIEVSLDGAQLPGPPPALPSLSSQPAPALTVGSFKAGGRGLSVGPAALDFALTATGVELYQAKDHSGKIVLLLHNAAQGRVEASVSKADLEALIAEAAQSQAGKHGVKIDNVQLSLRSQGPRSLSAEVSLRVQKLFLSASLRITGQLDLDDALNARLSALDCTGEGAIAGIACNVLKPHLEKLNGREFPLMSLPLGEARLRDVRLAAGDKLSVTAVFSSAS